MKKNQKVIGLKRLDYVSKKSGRPVQGYEIHTQYEDTDIHGIGAKMVYVNDINLARFGVNPNDLYGRFVEIFEDFKGNVVFLRVLDD